ncbi:hypothetical protein JZ751_018257 [Albula glossodonta]|uniref:Uncharacterized protein n=1 Tax=Albula glossodonta TaxID=121402 RepID=A0A8T2NRY4_9TELE|nr:hypothetical protein JZ751_018257 [Albula glossodonta]
MEREEAERGRSSLQPGPHAAVLLAPTFPRKPAQCLHSVLCYLSTLQISRVRVQDSKPDVITSQRKETATGEALQAQLGYSHVKGRTEEEAWQHKVLADFEAIANSSQCKNFMDRIADRLGPSVLNIKPHD